ncbi:hypothetical protein K2P56_01855 [Patescibacteria group bacterium]|nr:hypothetical protein [Patescibacteria group bacterium]
MDGEPKILKASLKDIFLIKVWGKPNLREIKDKRRELAFLVTGDCRIILGELYHISLAMESGTKLEDALALGHIVLGRNNHIEMERNFPDNRIAMEQGLREKLTEWATTRDI